jgi:rubredoxin
MDGRVLRGIAAQPLHIGALTMRTFEGSYLGDASRIAERTRLECKVCWYVYDPAVGDDVWQVAPGTPFSDLPAHWSCPNCEGSRDQFMVLKAE